jgi:dihydroorotase-like cyclic amidohydrolase
MLLPSLLTAALRGRLPVERVVRLVAGEPARLFGLSSRKGAIRPGLDADLCLYDPRPETIVRREQMWSKAADIDKLYEGYHLQGCVAATYVGGRLVFRGGEILAPAGSGEFVRPL